MTKESGEQIVDSVVDETRQRMLRALEVFPFISASMLHQAIGTATSSRLWKPILQQLVQEGQIVTTIINSQSVTGRSQSYTIYHLPRNEYTYNK